MPEMIHVRVVRYESIVLFLRRGWNAPIRGMLYAFAIDHHSRMEVSGCIRSNV